MNILIDAAVLEHKATGIAKTTLFLYNHCLEHLPTMKVKRCTSDKSETTPST